MESRLIFARESNNHFSFVAVYLYLQQVSQAGFQVSTDLARQFEIARKYATRCLVGRQKNCGRRGGTNCPQKTFAVSQAHHDGRDVYPTYFKQSDEIDVERFRVTSGEGVAKIYLQLPAGLRSTQKEGVQTRFVEEKATLTREAEHAGNEERVGRSAIALDLRGCQKMYFE
jgi:hypothetical protein